MNGNLDFTIVANNYVPVTVTVNRQDGTPLDMTGYTVKVGVFNPADLSPVITKSTGASTVTISTNILAFNFQPADTVNLQLDEYTDYVIEIVVTDPSGNPITLTEGDPRLMWGILTIRKQWTVQ